MLSIFSRKQRVECYPFVRKICDLTAPNMPSVEEGRCERRYNRSLPVILCPWKDEELFTDKCVMAITKDISDQGLSLILTHPLGADQMIIAFWLRAAELEEPWCFRVRQRSEWPLGGGFWQIGFELREYMNREWREKLKALRPVAAGLLPPEKNSDEGIT